MATLGDRQRGPYTAGYRQFLRLDEIVEPPPTKAFVFIDGRPDSINDPALTLDMKGFDPREPAAYSIVDYLAAWHNRGANLSFADGHVENWHWRDLRTMPHYRAGVPLVLNVPSPHNPDVARLQAATSSKVRP